MLSNASKQSSAGGQALWHAHHSSNCCVAVCPIRLDSTFGLPCERSCRPNATAQATLDALDGARSRRRAVLNPRAQLLLSNSSQMNLAPNLLPDSSGGQQASPVHLQPGQQASPVHLQPGQQASPVQLQPWQQELTQVWRSGAAPAIHAPPHGTPDGFADFLMRVQAGRLQGAAAAGSANRCAAKVSSSLPCSQLVLPHEAAWGDCCLHDRCARQNS